MTWNIKKKIKSENVIIQYEKAMINIQLNLILGLSIYYINVPVYNNVLAVGSLC